MVRRVGRHPKPEESQRPKSVHLHSPRLSDERFMTIMSIERRLLSILEERSSPLTPEELIGGWSKESKSVAHKCFSELSAAFASNTPLPPLGIARSLDHCGVAGGTLLDSIAAVTNDLRRISGSN